MSVVCQEALGFHSLFASLSLRWQQWPPSVTYVGMGALLCPEECLDVKFWSGCIGRGRVV